MKRSPLAVLAPRAFTTLYALAAFCCPIASSNAEPPANGSATPSASQGAAATPVAPRAIAGTDIPDTSSAAPSAAEWSTGKLVKPGRGSSGACTLSLLREWLRVECKEYAGAGLVAGDPKGVKVAVNRPDQPFVTTVVLPIRRGEAKIVTFLAPEFEAYGGATLRLAATLSVVWRAGRADPVLVMR